MTAIPDEIMCKIREAARSSWPDDREMQKYVIEAEADSYRALQELDFSALAPARERLIGEAWEFLGCWEDVLSSVVTEVDAFRELQELEPDDIPAEHVESLKLAAEREHSDYSSQLDHVQNGIASFRYVRDTRAKIGPIRDLIVRMERLIGEECYNANIQNYSAWGVWEGEGRSFRYPVTFVADGKEIKKHGWPSGLQPEALVTGHYKFGANELSIYRALVRVVEMLEQEYGFRPTPSGKANRPAGGSDDRN